MMDRKEREALLAEMKTGMFEQASEWLHVNVLYRMSTWMLWASIIAIIVLEQVLNFSFIDHICLVGDEVLIGLPVAALANEILLRLRLKKALKAKQKRQLETASDVVELVVYDDGVRDDDQSRASRITG